MLILKITNNDVIRYLESFSGTLGKRVPKSIYDKITEVFDILKNRTVGDSRYIEVSEHEADNVLTEYLSHMCTKHNLTAIVYLGFQASVYAKSKIKEILNNATVIYTFPTALKTNKIFIFLSFLDDSYSELYDVDYAMNMLKYYD